MLMISTREFYALIESGKFHPVFTKQRHQRIPLAEVMALKQELANRASVLPHEKFIQACGVFAENAFDVNRYVTSLGYFKVPIDYIERLRVQLEVDKNVGVIKVASFGELLTALGKAAEIQKRPDLRTLVECLHMICKGDKEIADTVRAKYGREYSPEDIGRYIEYFFSWRSLDHESAKFYLEMLTGREKLLKECAYRRADPFIYYALGVDFGGEVSELLERSSLGLIHKLNFFIDGYVYGDGAVSLRDLQSMVDIIGGLLGSAKDVREGKVPKGKQGELIDNGVPKAFSRTAFFETEKKTQFNADPPK
jgi:hypothetical protein